jgi:hypothetical protein
MIATTNVLTFKCDQVVLLRATPLVQMVLGGLASIRPVGFLTDTDTDQEAIMPHKAC